jgi:hypothetical protein
MVMIAIREAWQQAACRKAHSIRDSRPERITDSSSKNAVSVFICSHNEMLPVVAMRASNPDYLPFGINC